MSEEVFKSLSQAAKYARVSRQAIFLGIQRGYIVGAKKDNKWHITKKDIDTFRENKRNGDLREVDGEPLFDVDGGYYSVSQVSKVTGVHINRIYYLIKKGRLKVIRKGVAVIITKKEADLLYLKEKDRPNYSRQKGFP